MPTCENCGKSGKIWEVNNRLLSNKNEMILCDECYYKLEENITGRAVKNKNVNVTRNCKQICIALKIFAVISTAICLLAGLNLFYLEAQIESIMLVYYNSMGLFVIGLSFFIGPLIWGISSIIEKNYEIADTNKVIQTYLEIERLGKKDLHNTNEIKLQCPKCEMIFFKEQEAKSVQCPSCGFGGKVEDGK